MPPSLLSLEPYQFSQEQKKIITDLRGKMLYTGSLVTSVPEVREGGREGEGGGRRDGGEGGGEREGVGGKEEEREGGGRGREGRRERGRGGEGWWMGTHFWEGAKAPFFRFCDLQLHFSATVRNVFH